MSAPGARDMIKFHIQGKAVSARTVDSMCIPFAEMKDFNFGIATGGKTLTNFDEGKNTVTYRLGFSPEAFERGK